MYPSTVTKYLYFPTSTCGRKAGSVAWSVLSLLSPASDSFTSEVITLRWGILKARVLVLKPYFHLSCSSSNVYSPAGANRGTAAQTHWRDGKYENCQFHYSLYERKRLSCDAKNVKCRSFFFFLTMTAWKVMILTGVNSDSKCDTCGLGLVTMTAVGEFKTLW